LAIPADTAAEGVRAAGATTRPVDPVVRFETPPGYQGQVDFGTFQLPWGRRYALLVVLGYSRLLWMRVLSAADAYDADPGTRERL